MYLRSSRILLMAADTSGRSEVELVRKEDTVPEVTGTSSSIAWSWDKHVLTCVIKTIVNLITYLGQR